MKRLVITFPEELADRVTNAAILDLLEPGASRHTLMIRHGEGTNAGKPWTEIHHSRLGITIRTEYEQ